MSRIKDVSWLKLAYRLATELPSYLSIFNSLAYPRWSRPTLTALVALVGDHQNSLFTRRPKTQETHPPREFWRLYPAEARTKRHVGANGWRSRNWIRLNASALNSRTLRAHNGSDDDGRGCGGVRAAGRLQGYCDCAGGRHVQHTASQV